MLAKYFDIFGKPICISFNHYLLTWVLILLFFFQCHSSTAMVLQCAIANKSEMVSVCQSKHVFTHTRPTVYIC